jgi:hypothetical protein
MKAAFTRYVRFFGRSGSLRTRLDILQFRTAHTYSIDTDTRAAILANACDFQNSLPKRVNG